MSLQTALHHPSLRLSNIPLSKCTTASSSIHVRMDTCFHVLAVVNNAAVTIGVCVYFQICVFAFFPSGYISGSGIAGSYGSSIFSFFEQSPHYFL